MESPLLSVVMPVYNERDWLPEVLRRVRAVPIAKDATHIHMGDGSSCTNVELAAGEHTLVAVVADGAHFPLLPPVTSTITFMVK